MITIHQKAIRGQTRSGWLTSFHTFSFGSFQDPHRMGFGNLRVLNDDTVIPGAGFAPHRHESMDILTYVLNGQLRHEDDQGNVSLINAGDVQLMSAGSGIQHSEWNASDAAPAHFVQIWLIPDAPGGAPTYQQKTVAAAGSVLLAGPEGSGALLRLRSGSSVTLVRAKEGEQTLLASPDTLQFVHLLDGLAHAETERLSAGDGLEMPRGMSTTLDWATDGAALLFRLPSFGARV